MRTSFIILVAWLMLMAGCSSIDCPLNNTTHANYKLAGLVTTLVDTLTISTTKTTGEDSVLINRDVDVDSFILPMSYTQPQDVFFVELRDTFGNVTVDQVTVTKENHPHFESVDCNISFFHYITRVRWTHNAIDSVVVNKQHVDYDASTEHFHIYFKARR